MTMTSDQRVQLHPQVVDTDLDGDELALLHLETKTYYSLNATGRRIWNGLKQQLSLSEISSRLQEEFQVDAQTADVSVIRLLHDLQQLVVV